MTELNGLNYTNGNGLKLNGNSATNGTHQNGGVGGLNGSSIYHETVDHPSDLYKVKDLVLCDVSRAHQVSDKMWCNR